MIITAWRQVDRSEIYEMLLFASGLAETIEAHSTPSSKFDRWSINDPTCNFDLLVS